MLTKEKLTDAYKQGLWVILNGRKVQIVAIIMDVVAVKSLDSDKIIWLHLDSFFKGECTIEQHKQKIDLSILKEGEIYFGKTNESNWIFKFKELTNNNNIRGHFFYDFEYYTNIYEGDSSILKELRLPTDSELELFYSKFPELKPKPKYNGRAVKCYTVDQLQWLFKTLADSNYEIKNIDINNCFNITIVGFASEKYYIENNYEIISFSDYCKEQINEMQKLM